MKKILFYTPFITVGGGVQKVLVDYVNTLSEKGYEVDVISDFNMGLDEQTYVETLDSSINFEYIKSEKVSKFIYMFRTLGKKNKLFNIFLYGFMILFDFYYYHTKVKKIVQDGKYDWTISFYQFLPSYITNIKSAKHMIWLHGSVEHFFGGITKIFKNSYGRKLENYDYVVTIADEMREQLVDFYPNISEEKIIRIYNPFDFETIKNKSIDSSELTKEDKELLTDKYICTVARLDLKAKDFTTLFKAYEILTKSNLISHKLYVVGDGPHKKELENIVEELNLSDYILFVGRKYNPYIWIKNADIYVLSSKSEGLPTVLIEAMTVETFVISSKCKTGPTEILQDGICGDLVDVEDVEMLAQKIQHALENKKYRDKKIQKATQRIVEFSKDTVLEDFIKLINGENDK